MMMAKLRISPPSSQQSGDVDIGPELLAVGRDAPSLILCPAGLHRLVQLTLGHAILNVFRGEDASETPAHDFGLSVTQQMLCSTIPTADAPHRIHGEERVVLDSLYQQPKTSVALRQPGLEDGAVALLEKCMTQRTQQIARRAQAGAAYRALFSCQVPKFLRRNVKVLGHPPQWEWLGISVEDLPGNDCP